MAFCCLRDKAPGKAADIESERLSAAGSMSGMADVSPGARAWFAKGAGAPSARTDLSYHMKTF